ncbi:MAG: hypothetical protein NUV64_01615 [Parcubacteria group bacterium]|nr:hypothetical protein [Parcubacteria group bacterium]MCR4342741.1 hypothetical protein [Patescibacteria group bacterium]
MRRTAAEKINNSVAVGLILILEGVLGIFFIILALSGCSAIEATGGRTELSATGGPGSVLSTLADLHMNGSLQTTPGGFTIRNDDPGIGAISNEDRGVSKDVDIYVRSISSSGGNGYILYRGPAEVQTPGWVKIWNEETGKWDEIKTPRWITVDGLESIHFESPFVQSVTLRLRLSHGKIQEVKFDTYGRKDRGSAYERINILFIKLPRASYRLEVFSYTGKSIFKSARGYPTSRHIYMDDDPVDTRVGNTWIGWKERL